MIRMRLIERLGLAAILLLGAGRTTAQPAPAAPSPSTPAASAAPGSPANPAPPTAEDPKVRAAFSRMLEACTPDLRLYCSGIPFGNPDFGACIRENYFRLSFTCQTRLRHMPRVLPGLNTVDRDAAPLPPPSKIK